MKNSILTGGTISLLRPLPCKVWMSRRGSALCVSVYPDRARAADHRNYGHFGMPLPYPDPTTQRLKDVLPHDNRMVGRLVALTVKIDSLRLIFGHEPIKNESIRLVVDIYDPKDTTFRDIKMKVVVNGRTGEAEILVDNLPNPNRKERL